MTLVGKYVTTFAEATHALPEGMHMNADYPFMLPPIVERGDGTITIQGRGGKTATVKIRRSSKSAFEFAYLEQSSSFETIYRRKPTRFRLMPFRDNGETK